MPARSSVTLQHDPCSGEFSLLQGFCPLPPIGHDATDSILTSSIFVLPFLKHGHVASFKFSHFCTLRSSRTELYTLNHLNLP
jgi:hypothetical protein